MRSVSGDSVFTQKIGHESYQTYEELRRRGKNSTEGPTSPRDGDMWAAGIVLFMFIFKCHPFAKCVADAGLLELSRYSILLILLKFSRNMVRYKKDKEKFLEPFTETRKISGELRGLIHLFLSSAGELTPQEVLQHPFLEGFPDQQFSHCVTAYIEKREMAGKWSDCKTANFVRLQRHRASARDFRKLSEPSDISP